ncbi:MAG: RagB/SusD family nutrient uptake outer membrane protein [Bacteroidota bacterium]
MKKISLLSIFILIIIASCTKLDEVVYDKIPGNIYPENQNQIANLSVQCYAKIRPFIDDEGWWFLAQELSSDELCGPTRGSDWYDGGKWVNMYKHTWSNDDEGVNRMWGVFWSAITSCNITIDMMKDLPQNENVKIKVKEVEVLRSFYYYLLIDNYGDAPYLTTSKNTPEKPFKISRKAIYDSLVNTVTSGLPYLKPINNKYMVTRYTGFALLAKLYLNAEVYNGTANWAKAEQYCDSVIAGPFTLESDISAPFKVNNQLSSEIIFSIPFDEDNFQGFRLHMRTLHYQHNLKYDMPVGPWNGFCITPQHFDTYETADLRRIGYNIFGLQKDSKGAVILDALTQLPLNIDPHVPALTMTAASQTPFEIRCTGARVGKYEIKLGTKENLSNDFPIFRLTDFYLMKAEARIRQSGNGDQWINPIRLRAGVSSWVGATLVQLLAERGRELYCEGHRRQDLIRFGEFENAWWEKPATTSERRLFPIPKWATDANPNLLQ